MASDAQLYFEAGYKLTFSWMPERIVTSLSHKFSQCPFLTELKWWYTYTTLVLLIHATTL